MSLVDDAHQTLVGMLAMLPVVLYAFDEQGTCTLSVGGGLTTMGVPQHGFEGNSMFSDNADNPELLRALRETLAGRDTASAGTVGGVTWESQLRPLRDDHGAVIGGVGLSLDVRYRTQADAMFEESRLDAQQLLRAIPDQLVWLDADGRVLATKPTRSGSDDERVLATAVGSMVDDVLDERLVTDLRAHMRDALAQNDARTFDYRVADGDVDRHFEARVVPGRNGTVLLMLRDVTERQRLENELQHAQRLEAIGRLAGGIAHEINTPIQFIGDNVRFLQQSFTTTVSLVESYRQCLFGGGDMSRAERVAVAEAAERTADVNFLTEEVPAAVNETIDGVQRVATIVKAMKAVGRASQAEQTAADLNAALESTLVVSRSEYKHLAHIDLDLGDLPPVVCHVGELNQVFLNLIVNAAHAIAERVAETGERGRIGLRTRADGDDVVIEISDDGAGIPEEIRHRVFEPFFTTKEVGKGTGQGLSLSRSLVVDRHGGTISVDSTPGVGTTFTIRLPVAGLPATGQPARAVSSAAVEPGSAPV
ncbi:MAG TPA: ATP-binding protein [Euzebyales bacterium]|nr:ATP-binding protein [Euzebyales bacterium]